MSGSIASLARDAARRFGSKPAINVGGARVLSFGEVDRLAGQMAAGLRARGIGRGDRVVLHLPNGWEWIVGFHAIVRLGAVVVPANILLSPAEVDFIADNSGARAAVVAADRAHALAQRQLLLIVSGGGESGLALEALLAGDPMVPVDVAPHELLAIGYTSGTTGKPKGAMLSHGNVHWSTAQTASVHLRHHSDRIYSALPLPHVYGNVVMNTCFLTGAYLFGPSRFSAAEALRDIARERITLFEGVPTMYYQMLAQREIEQADLSTLARCTVGGQSMPIAKIDAVKSRFGCPVLELWGMTELAGPAISHAPGWPARHGSVGRAFPGVELRIAGAESGEEASPGERGELLIRGPLVTSGYWNDPSATAATIDRNGWLATGDIATIDDDGYVCIVDRKKDVILTAGYNIYPAELEQVIAMHPAVAMAAVAGVADEEKGELACAFVVLNEGDELDERALLDHCRQHLAAYKVPRSISFVDDLPKTSTGKILRRALRHVSAPHPQA